VPENAFLSLDDPARYAATVLAETLESRGVRVAGGVATSAAPLPPDLRALASVSSPPLREIVRQINQPSHNLRAEILLRLLGLRARGEGSARAGLASALEFLARHGVPTDGLDLRDGCGLAPTNLVTARALALLLVTMRHHVYAQDFVESLPLAGSEGTLRRRFRGTPVEGRLRAKTGYMSHTTTLAGYLPTRDDELAVVILLNHDTQEPAAAQAAVDALVLAIAER
jgi:D-alanyl-D-alanine carboxypeptidase/D-alanyl-D-alanine-endopeptidase (penicillin-binding protein 4)